MKSKLILINLLMIICLVGIANATTYIGDTTVYGSSSISVANEECIAFYVPSASTLTGFNFTGVELGPFIADIADTCFLRVSGGGGTILAYGAVTTNFPDGWCDMSGYSLTANTYYSACIEYSSWTLIRYAMSDTLPSMPFTSDTITFVNDEYCRIHAGGGCEPSNPDAEWLSRGIPTGITYVEVNSASPRTGVLSCSTEFYTRIAGSAVGIFLILGLIATATIKYGNEKLLTVVEWSAFIFAIGLGLTAILGC